MLELLKQAKRAAIPAKYVLFDSWFSSPSSIHAVNGNQGHIFAIVPENIFGVFFTIAMTSYPISFTA